MDLDKRLQRLQGNFQPGLDGKPFGYGTFLPMTEGSSKIPSKRSRENHSQTTNQHIVNQQMRNNQPTQASVTSDPANDDDASQIPSNSTETTSPSKIIQVMTIPLGPLLSPFISVPNSSEPQVQQQSTSVMVEDNAPTNSNLLNDVSNLSEITNKENSEDQIHEDKISKLKSNTENIEVQQSVSKQEENAETEKQQIPTLEKEKKETEATPKSQTPESVKEKNREKVSTQETSNEKVKDRKTKSIDKQRTDDKKSKDKEESREKKQDKKSKDSRAKDTKSKKSQEKELDKKKDKRDQTRTRSSSRSPSRSRSRERDRGRNYERDRDYKEKRRRRSYSYSSDDGNASSPSRSRYSSSDSERDSRKRRRKGKSRSRSRTRSRDRKDRDRKDRDRSKNKKRKRSKSRDRGFGKSTEDSKKSKAVESDITNLSTSNMKDASLIAEECKKNATKLKHVADKLSDKSQAGEIYFQSGLQFLACAHAYEEGNMHDKAVMMYQQTGTFFESIAKMYSHDEKFKVLVSMCCKCVAVALTRRFILDPSRLRQLHSDLSTSANSNTANSTTNTGTPNRSPSSNSTTQNTLDPSPPQVVSTSPSLPSASSNTERSSSSNTSQNHSSQPTVRLKGEKQQNLYDMIKCFEMWGRAEKNLAIQHFSMTNVKELIQSLTQYAKTNLTPASTNQED